MNKLVCSGPVRTPPSEVDCVIETHRIPAGIRWFVEPQTAQSRLLREASVRGFLKNLPAGRQAALRRRYKPPVTEALPQSLSGSSPQMASCGRFVMTMPGNWPAGPGTTATRLPTSPRTAKPPHDRTCPAPAGRRRLHKAVIKEWIGRRAYGGRDCVAPWGYPISGVSGPFR